MIAIGSDHGGFALKEEIKKYLDENKIAYQDYGTFSEQSVDYPQIAKEVCTQILAGKHEKGILCCGTGIGISMAANKIKGIRAALCADYFSAKYTRLHNDANVICLGGRTIGSGLACELVQIFLDTPFEGGRHQNRVAQMMALENE